MKKNFSNRFGTPFAILALVALSACTSSMELEDGDYTGEETVATTEGEEAAPADAVPGEELAAETPPAGEAETNPELELAKAGGAEGSTEAAPVASTESPSSQASEMPPPVEELPPLDLATESALPPPADVDVTPKVVTPEAKTEVAAATGTATPEVSEPAAPPAPVQEVASADGATYTVQKGDTLMRISWEQYGDLFRWREIYALNKAKIADPNNVPPGTVLQIAGQGRSPASAMEHNGEQYLIVFGDTLGKISSKVYGSMGKWKMIWENNKRLIRDPNKIYAGFYLYYVPEAKMTAVDEEADLDSSES
jgi:LysM repeat protein